MFDVATTTIRFHNVLFYSATVQTVNISEPVRFVSRMKSESIRKGKTAELECSAQGDFPIEITWSKEDKMIQEDQRFL